MAKFNRIFLIVLDSVGVGELPDAHLYNDEGSDTLGHIDKEYPKLNLPNLERLGLGYIKSFKQIKPVEDAYGAYGKMAEKSKGKDTTTGHWELMGLILDKAFPVYPEGFPENLIKEFESRINTKVLGNYPASGTVIINELGDEHVKTGYPIVYTSADSVFQIAAHEEVIPVEKLYKMCEIARELLQGEHAVGRVIARPFVGKNGNYTRTSRRHDFSLKPVSKTALDYLCENGIETYGIGKIYDIFAGVGIKHTVSTKSNEDGCAKIYDHIKKVESGFIFANLVDFDMKYGHRNDVKGYVKALMDFDSSLGFFLDALAFDDLLIITADHGCDPTTESTDHSREYVPLLAYHRRMDRLHNLGVRECFCDVGKTVLDNFNIKQKLPGKSFLSNL